MDRIMQYREFIFNMTDNAWSMVAHMTDEDVIKWMEEHYPDYLTFIWDYTDK